MVRSLTGVSIKTLIVILSLAEMPGITFAQGTGGATGSAGGVGNAPASPPGTNSLGTAQASGRSPGVTTGAASGTNPNVDATVNAENRLLDKKLKSICRGC